MMTIAPIVEGHGEVGAVPELLRRLASWIAPYKAIQINPPIRTNKAKFLSDQIEFFKKIQLAKLKASTDGWVLIILDADDDCPVNLCSKISERAKEQFDTKNIAVVIANREFEAWFIASAASLSGVRGFTLNTNSVVIDPDAPRDAKGWLGRQMPHSYHEVSDQPAFCARMSLEDAWNASRSFRRLTSEFIRMSKNLSS
jgi:Domain of unknown function (DUF4276)